MIYPEPKTIRKWLPRRGHYAHFTHRDLMRERAIRGNFHAAKIPATPLPCDCTGNATVKCPMDLNDTIGCCMLATAAHVDGILTYRQGKGRQSFFWLKPFRNQYLAASGGDNGLDEPTLLAKCWKPGIAWDSAATYAESLDIDVTNVPLARFAIDNFYAVPLMWSVPDDFLQKFDTGTVWAAAATPDPNNGHGTPLADIMGPTDVADDTSLDGFYRLWTWGTWCYVSPAFVASVDPSAFVVFSTRQFDSATGLDSKGRSIQQQAALWVEYGGAPIPAEALNAFPKA